MSKKVIRTFRFKSSSDPSKIYETLLYEDGTSSCNCPGWTRRVQPDGSRICKHIISAGLAPVEIEGSAPVKAKGSYTSATGNIKQTKPEPAPTLRVVRRFNWDD